MPAPHFFVIGAFFCVFLSMLDQPPSASRSLKKNTKLLRSSPSESVRLSPLVVQVEPDPQSRFATSSLCVLPLAALKYSTLVIRIVLGRRFLIWNLTSLHASPA